MPSIFPSSANTGQIVSPSPFIGKADGRRCEQVTHGNVFLVMLIIIVCCSRPCMHWRWYPWCLHPMQCWAKVICMTDQATWNWRFGKTDILVQSSSNKFKNRSDHNWFKELCNKYSAMPSGLHNKDGFWYSLWAFLVKTFQGNQVAVSLGQCGHAAGNWYYPHHSPCWSWLRPPRHHAPILEWLLVMHLAKWPHVAWQSPRCMASRQPHEYQQWVPECFEEQMKSTWIVMRMDQKSPLVKKIILWSS